MTHLFLFFIWSVSLSFASSEILTSLQAQNFLCQSMNVANCTYQECLGTLPNYPKPVLIVVPKKIAALRLHFHGHKLGKFPAYEKNLSSMVKAFGLNDNLCTDSEVVVFPESSGNCTTYDESLKDQATIETFIKDLHSATSQNLKSAPLHISAHSGGGRVLSRFLSSGTTTAKVSVFDGIYSEEVKKILSNWYQTSDGNLMLATVKGMSPDTYSTKLKKEISVKLETSAISINGTKFDVSKGKRFIHFSRSAGEVSSLKAHYDVLTQTWPYSP